jgi:predicted deacetylase
LPVHVSIHDVSPAWEREVDVALDVCHEHHVRPALLVVPDFHGRAKLSDHPAYCEKLRALQATGHEIYLHGYYHRAQHLGGAGSYFRQKVVSAGEAEFAAVSEDEAKKRLDDGERMLRDAGLSIRGFVAPAWSMPRWVLAMLGVRGYGFTEDHLRIYDPAKKTSRASLVLNFASRTPGRLFSSAAWCRIARPARRVVPARIALHPADMRFALLRSETSSLLRWAEGDFVESGADLFRS